MKHEASKQSSARRWKKTVSASSEESTLQDWSFITGLGRSLTFMPYILEGFTFRSSFVVRRLSFIYITVVVIRHSSFIASSFHSLPREQAGQQVIDFQKSVFLSMNWKTAKERSTMDRFFSIEGKKVVCHRQQKSDLLSDVDRCTTI